MANLVAALSGGVDSAVAAARLAEAGHQVTAIHLALLRQVPTTRSGSRGCCSVEDALDARRVADKLGLDFYIWDLSAEFQHWVVDDFVAEYARGHTPNPCLRCNERIKFAAVLERALELGFDGIATGHYARLVADNDGSRRLHRAQDLAKDQSYVLGVMTAEQLAKAYFPLGDSTKAEVRAEALRRGLRVADKPDSTDICFIPDGDTPAWLAGHLGYHPGLITDEAGEIVGSHQGSYAYTVGQRRGLRLGRPAADGRPRYVLRVDAEANQVVVGPRPHLQVTRLWGNNPRWCGPQPEDQFQATVQLRAHGEEHPAEIRLYREELDVADLAIRHAARSRSIPTYPYCFEAEITLATPAYGIAPGQAAVIYRGSEVVGSVTITRTA